MTYFHGNDTQNLYGLHQKHLLYFDPYQNKINRNVEKCNIRLKTCLFEEFKVQEREDEKGIMV
jgi:hypothetical protein